MSKLLKEIGEGWESIKAEMPWEWWALVALFIPVAVSAVIANASEIPAIDAISSASLFVAVFLCGRLSAKM